MDGWKLFLGAYITLIVLAAFVVLGVLAAGAQGLDIAANS